MIPSKAYAAVSAKKPLQPFQLQRRDPRPDDIVIEIAYCGICHSDIHTARGEWGPTAYPCVPGHEIVGTVVATGKKVRRFKPGDLAGVVPRSDGTEVAVVRASDQVDFAALRADGTVAAVRSLAGSSTTEAVGFGRDEVIIGVPRGLAVFDVAGAVRVLPSVDGVTHLARAGDALDGDGPVGR